MTKVRCNYERCDFNDNGICNRGSIALYAGECESLKIKHDFDDYDDQD